MVTTNSTVKANIFLLPSKRSQNLHGYLCSIKSLQFRATSKFAGLQVQRLMVNSNSSPITITNNDIIRSSTKEEEEELVEKYAIDDTIIIKTLKWLKIPATVVVSSLLFGMMMYGRCQSALALSGDVMGGHSYSSSSSSSSSSSEDDPYYSTSETETCRCRCSCCSGSVYVSGRRCRSRVKVSDRRPIPILHYFFYIPLFFVLLVILKKSVEQLIEDTRNVLEGWDEEWDELLEAGGKMLAELKESSSVYKIQVGMLVTGSSLRSDFNRIATTADTSGSSGWKYILEETIKSLYRHRSDWLYGDSSVYFLLPSKAEEVFEDLLNKERNKFEYEEIHINLNNIKKESISSKNQEADESITTYMVVTIFVAFRGLHIMSGIFKEENLDRVFSKIRSPYSDIKRVNVLWAPQKANEILSREELEKKYPLLKKISK